MPEPMPGGKLMQATQTPLPILNNPVEGPGKPSTVLVGTPAALRLYSQLALN